MMRRVTAVEKPPLVLEMTEGEAHEIRGWLIKSGVSPSDKGTLTQLWDLIDRYLD